jgi:hypothetical protein
MALDEPRDTDELFDIDGFQFLINKDFMVKAQPIKVDFLGMGFKLDCALEFSPAGGCSGCGSDSSCGSGS